MMASTWIEQLETALKQTHGSTKGSKLSAKYQHAFPAGYQDDYPASIAVLDIDYLDNLNEDKPLELKFYISTEQSEYPLHLRFYQWQEAIPLADMLPMLENMDLRAYNEHPHKITLEHGKKVWISDFTVVYTKAEFNIEKIQDIFQDAFIKIRQGLLENDGFNKLILGASLNWREIIILRTYAKYLRQVGFRFSQPYIEKALAEHPDIARDLISLFEAQHNPTYQKTAKKRSKEIEERILHALEQVTSLDEDRIIRRMIDLIKATLRTNYYLTQSEGEHKEYLSIKLSSRDIPELPLPKPLYEIFVYSPRFEAIHLRNASVARGGLRWSDRKEDFRTEILGLMKAQTVKNAVIVPSGAKGGFVLKMLMPQASREATQQEVILCYKSFIRGMLDITDNIKDGKVIHPKHIVCLDGDDPYLVVAADKGTATFSDIANSISKEYDFWLGDAFASGGSNGYDHKKMGITARGAWESVKRHFRELNIDVMKENISVIGVGDMSGDVFGNGMLYTKHIKLIAAFDHRHIFIDPNPNPEKSYQERERLFNLPTSSWENYNPRLISEGGGVFKRSLKSITLTPQMKKVLGTDEHSLAPNELIRCILKAPVDLFFNGGIGTYVKASHESNADVGDRTNDYCRVNGDELRANVVGEGGNLGFTQLGRIEYALSGGLINTDFIDNSAGVDCSDHEVNLKILLDNEVKQGHLTEKKRDSILASLTEEVAELVLHDNYAQALVMSFSAFHASKNIGLHQSYLHDLENLGIINRKVEFLPDDKTIAERKSTGHGFTRPELAVLLEYTKIHIKHEILKTNLPEDDYVKKMVETAFPISLRKKYRHAMLNHTLHREIIATQLSNAIVNAMGFTYVFRVQAETGAPIEEIIRAFLVATAIFDAKTLRGLVESFGFKMPLSEQYDMLFQIRNLINLATRWFLHNKRLKSGIKDIINTYRTHVTNIEKHVPTLMGGYTKAYLDKLENRFKELGIPTEHAERIATYRAMYTTLNIIEVAESNHFDLLKTAQVYFAGGETINLIWFRDQIAADSREGHWNVLARLTLRDELDYCQRTFTVAVMNSGDKKASAKELINHWTNQNQYALHRWGKVLELIHESSHTEYTMFFIAIRELLGLLMMSQESA